MMTSLKVQLNKLADAHTQWQLTESENRKRASFLYDPKVASTLDRETIYCQGINGFEELCLLDSGFQEFENALFTDQALNFERSIQSKEVNDALDLSIRRFLVRLSPYFLLSPAHKALEWLIHRFFIHFYNVDDLMRCILPYHEHNYFVRAIQMIRFNDRPSSWNWLEPSQSAGTTISGMVVANRCGTDLGFLNFICQSLDMAIKEFGPSKSSSLRVMINFYLKTLCTTILHSLSKQKKKKKKKQTAHEENFISQFMPYLLKGLKSKSTDFKRANYLIVSHLSKLFTFQSNVQHEILNVLSKGFSDEIIEENLLVSAVFLNNQRIFSIPDRFFEKLSTLTNVVERFNGLAVDVRIDHLICAWIKQLFDRLVRDENEAMESSDKEIFSKLIDQTFQTIHFNSIVLRFIIDLFIERFNSKNSTFLVSLASIIERKYPRDFDDNIRQHTENSANDEQRKKIREFASMTATGFKHQPLSDRTSLAICLNHPQAQLRIEALQKIREGIQSKQNIEKEFLLDVLHSRLADSSVDVVQESILLVEELGWIDVQSIDDLLQKILQREQPDWCKVQESIVRFLSLDVKNETRYFHLLFPSNAFELQLLNDLLENFKEKKTALLKLSKKIFKSISSENLASSLSSLIESINNNDEYQSESIVPLLEKHEEILRRVEQNRANSLKFTVIYILLATGMISQGKNVEFGMKLIWNLLKKLSKDISPNDENRPLIELHLIEKRPLTSTSYLSLWRSFVQAIPRDFNVENFLSESIEWLCNDEKLDIVHLLLSERFASNDEIVLFLAKFYLSRCDATRPQEILLKYLLKKSSKKSINDNLTTLIFIFLLRSSSRTIRSTTLKIFSSKFQTSNDQLEQVHQTIKLHENEILADPNYISTLIDQSIQTTKFGEKKKRKANREPSPLIELFKKTANEKENFNIELLRLLKSCRHWSIFYQYRTEFEQMLHQSEKILSIESNKTMFELIVEHVDYETFIHEESMCFDLLLQLFRRSIKESKSPTTISLIALALRRLTPEMFAAFKHDFDKQMQLIDECFSLCQRSNSSELTAAVQTTLSKFHFEAKHFLTHWKTLMEPNESATNCEMKLSNKKLIVNKSVETSSTSFIDWKSVRPSLEFLHKDQLLIDQTHELIRPMFVLFEKSLNQPDEIDNEHSYIQQLCITALINIYSTIKSDQCSSDAFNSEVVMTCLKRTTNLHTTQQCLLLLSKGAQLFPEKLINMIMEMFTFVGDRLVRKEDFYSYQVMEKTIRTVIPSLYKEKNIEQRRIILAKITHVFVISLSHVPAHRRQDIFRMVMESIGQDECLWFAPIQLFDSVLLSRMNKKNEDILKKSLIDASEQMLTSFNQFPASSILLNLTRILDVVLKMPDQINKNQPTPVAYSHLIDLRLYTTKHIHVLKYQLLTFVNNVLSADHFLKMMKKMNSVEKELNELIEKILHCLLWANKLSEDDAEISRYNKSILNKVYECLNKSIALLNSSMFVNIIINLLQQQQTNEKLQRKTLDIFNGRLRDETTPENEIVLFLPHIDQLFSIIEKYSTNEQEQTAQTALFTIKLLAKRLAEKHPKEFANSLAFVCQLLRTIDSQQHANLSASIHLCLAELCATLKVYSLGELPNFMPLVLETFHSEQITKHDLLLTSVIACLSKLVRTLCDYLTPYLSSIIKRTSTLLTEGSSTTDQRLRTMWSHLALHVPRRLLFPILYDVIEKNEFALRDLEPLMALLKQSLSNANLDDLSGNYALLKQLFLKLFTLRTTHTKQMRPNEMNVYEDHVFDCFGELVVRLSEETFRPLFYTIYEWAVYNEPPAEYTLTFYRLTFLLSKKLKGLFTLFAGHIIQHSANVLNQLNSSKTEKTDEFRIQFRKKHAEENQIELLQGVLGTLSNLCLFDSVGFITDERFQLLMMPVVDQLDNMTNYENYRSWIEQYVTPSIVHLTCATKEEPLWRQIHYQILLKTRSDSSKVRLATIHVLLELSRKLGMNYQSLLAEAIPFLAELMEDGNDEVEKMSHRLIVDMESTLGESLQDYFNS